MNALQHVLAFSSLALISVSAHAVVEDPTRSTSSIDLYSSSVLPDAPAAGAAVSSVAAPTNLKPGIRPFSHVGIALKVGVAGPGIEMATPLARKFNLRASGSFFNYNINNLTEDGFNINGSIKLQSVNTSLDWFPFGGSFRISPGVTVRNGNTFSGTAAVPSGQTITLNGVDYTSGDQNGNNPVTATFNTPNNRFGKEIAPSITMGFGNIVPRGEHKHFSVPFEIGMEYIGPPTINLALSGYACQQGQPASQGCGNVQTDASTQANIQAQQKTINSDIYNLRFYPILSIGFGYKF